MEIFEREHPRIVVLDFSAVSDIEYTALNMLSAGEEKLREMRVELWPASLERQPA